MLLERNWGMSPLKMSLMLGSESDINGLQPLEMTMDILLPSGETTEVEPRNALIPKDRILGITQRIVFHRIEAEKQRHDDRRGYRRLDNQRQPPRETRHYSSVEHNQYSKNRAPHQSSGRHLSSGSEEVTTTTHSSPSQM
ncbi:hypothetical protein F2Q69_00046582 [Brassica cretica]|uniref:Uncharacterized protein n=1 Tax=Brassica cretica TaxID=69181 RepID=A0A8S9PJJ2_BRACR|nr:hypothetical protein F2Q69_00046582 [Brassica cretica]